MGGFYDVCLKSQKQIKVWQPPVKLLWQPVSAKTATTTATIFNFMIYPWIKKDYYCSIIFGIL